VEQCRSLKSEASWDLDPGPAIVEAILNAVPAAMKQFRSVKSEGRYNLDPGLAIVALANSSAEFESLVWLVKPYDTSTLGKAVAAALQ